MDTITRPISGDANAAAADSSRRPFHVALKVVGPACNLNCTYCYYLHKEQLLGLPGLHANASVSDELLENFIRQYIGSQPVSTVIFTWHGGEPTLAGLDFYRRAVELQKKHTPSGKRVLNDIQTNGLLLDDSWCAFLREQEFLVGLSIDGPRDLHDAARRSQGGQPTFDRVYAAARRMREHGVPFNTLTVVSSANAKHAGEVYEFLTQDLGSSRQQYLPCVEHRDFAHVAPGHWDQRALPIIGSPRTRPGSADAIVTDWSVDAEDWGKFLCTVFDLWHARDRGKVQVNWFESWIGQWSGRPSTMCVTGETCGQAMAVELDGNIYSCDHFVYPEFRIGNIANGDDLGRAANSLPQLKFGNDKRDTLPLYCQSCRWRFACHGECPRRRFLRTPDGEAGLNYLCAGFQSFFRHAEARLGELALQRSDSNCPSIA